MLAEQPMPMREKQLMVFVLLIIQPDIRMIIQQIQAAITTDREFGDLAYSIQFSQWDDFLNPVFLCLTNAQTIFMPLQIGCDAGCPVRFPIQGEIMNFTFQLTLLLSSRAIRSSG